MEIQGLKPWTSAMPWQRSNQLSYIPLQYVTAKVYQIPPLIDRHKTILFQRTKIMMEIISRKLVLIRLLQVASYQLFMSLR